MDGPQLMLDTGKLDRITTFPALIDYLRDQLDWPIEEYSFDELTYEWEPKEFGLSAEGAAGQIEIKQLRPIEREPWGIFFLSLPHKKLPVTVLRRLLGGLAIRKRASANPAERAAWDKHDLLFIAAHGAGQERALAFAHFHEDKQHGDLPTLKVLGWDEADTIRRLSDTHRTLKDKLHWRDRDEDDAHWRARWNEAFREKPGESIATSKALAKELARLAREIRRRANELLAEESAQGPLRTLHKAFKEALIHDLKHDDFADMYAQTIAYGLLAAAISRESGALVADDAAALAPPTNPFLKELLQTFLSAGGRKGGMDFDELGVNDVVEMLRNADMHSVLLDFDSRNPNEDPVIHFYELFLKEYDAQKRMQRGVFYTPRPVVSFIVRSVDEVLRTEFGLEDGLASTATWGEAIAASKSSSSLLGEGDHPKDGGGAGAQRREIELPDGAKESDPFVRILDPATGTGTFLVEATDLIHERMAEKWRKAGKSRDEIVALWNDYVPDHLLPRLYGFELMMAPYAIAHMKLGLKLYETGYRFGSEERARIYLTNALEPAQDFDMQLAFMSEALAYEAKAANEAKEVRFTAVFGNPPYAGHSGNNHIKFIVDLVGEYSRDDPTLRGPGQGKWLQDDYVKFLRFGTFLLERATVGVVGMITNHRFLTNRTFRGLRQKWLRDFSRLCFIDLHGNITVQERSPVAADENVFDIEQGVGISLIVLDPSSDACDIHLSDVWGPRDAKYSVLQSGKQGACGARIQPYAPLFLFATGAQAPSETYLNWPSIVEMMPNIVGPNGAPQSGLATMHDAFAIGFTPAEVEHNVERFLSTKTRSEATELFGALCNPAQWDYAKAKAFLSTKRLWFDKVVAIAFSPFDTRYTVYDKNVAVHLRKRLTQHLHGRDNVALVAASAGQEVSGDEWDGAFCVNSSLQLNFFRRNGSPTFPLYAYDALGSTRRPNLATGVLEQFVSNVGLQFEASMDDASTNGSFGPMAVFAWTYAVLHSGSYRTEHAEQLKSSFPRIPLPRSRELFQALVRLGTRLVALHLLDADAAPELKDPQAVRFAGHGEARVEQASQWTPPSGGRVTISDHRWFEGVPSRVWEFHIGGYQPAQKWLKDRAKRGGKKASPGRVLTAEDQLHYRRMIAAMDRTIDLMAEIDRTIDAHGGWPGAFKGMSEGEDVA
jgi:predicted helicase